MLFVENSKIRSENYLISHTRMSLMAHCFPNLKNSFVGIPVVVQRRRVWLEIMRLQVRSLALLSGLSIQRCHELRRSSQMQLGSCTPIPGTSICHGWGPRKDKIDKKKFLCIYLHNLIF